MDAGLVSGLSSCRSALAPGRIDQLRLKRITAMSRSIALPLLSSALLACAAWAQAPVGAPAGTTAICKDGSFSSSTTKQGACSSHKGIKEWYGATATKVWANKDSQ